MRNRLLRAAFLLLGAGLLLTPGSEALAQLEPTTMRFEWVTEGPAASCGERCREWIAATGPITADTLRDFDTFGQMRDLHGATLVLHSGGGAVVPSLELGRKIRRLAMTTTVGRTIKVPGEPHEAQRARLSPRGECASMCAFVLLGGTQRRVPAEARVLVHQIWPGTKRHDASAETYSAEEIMRIQRDVGQIARYTVEMGADIEIFDLAMRIPPWEQLRALSPAELRRVGLQPVEAAAESATSGAASTTREGERAGARKGWSFVDGAPATLSRHHPLTVEGEEIGTFELTLGCQQPGGRYLLSYSERRPAGENEKAELLAHVALSLGRERIALTVESSAPEAGGGGSESYASGLVSSEFVEALRARPDALLRVQTQTTAGTNIGVRLGGTGFAAAVPRLLAACRTEVATVR